MRAPCSIDLKDARNLLRFCFCLGALSTVTPDMMLGIAPKWPTVVQGRRRGRGGGSIFNQKIIMSDGGVGGGNEITFELCGGRGR